MTKSEAKVLHEYYDKLVAKLMDAKLKLVEGSVKSYTIDDRTLTRYDIDTISHELDDAIKMRAVYGAIMNGRKARKAVGVVPRDF